MLARDGLTAFIRSLERENVLSVYLDGRTTDPAARLAWRSVLANQLEALKDDVRQRGARELPQLDACIALLDQHLAAKPGALRASGLAAFVTEQRIELIEELPVAMPNVAVWEKGPWVSPYIRAQKELRPVLLAMVDMRGARTYRYALGKLASLERFHAHVHVDGPSHMGAAPRQFFHPGTRGNTTTDTIDRALEHGTQRMLRELVEHMTREAPGDEWIVIGGAPMRCELLMATLPAAARRRAAIMPGVAATTSAASLRKLAAEVARRLRQRVDDEIVEEAIGRAAGRGRGSAGEAATSTALANNAVHMLLLSNRFTIEKARRTESLARLALAEGAIVEIVSGSGADRLDRIGGVAATLRFVASADTSGSPEDAAPFAVG